MLVLGCIWLASFAVFLELAERARPLPARRSDAAD
jgi:hypothetical protein